MFSNTWDVRLEISVVNTCVNLNGMSVHVKNWKIGQYTGLGWLSSIKQWEECAAETIAKHR